MEHFSKACGDLVHLARLSLTGRSQDVRAYVAQLGRRYRKMAPATGEQLATLAAEHLTPRSPVRNAEVAAVPVDADTRLDLLRYDPAPALDHPPVWAPEVATSLEAIVQEHTRFQDLARASLWPVRTAVFTGPPGVGKTLAARWLAAELSRPLVVLDLSAVMSSFLGRTGANLRHVLDYAKGVPCVLLLDEIDAIAKRRDDAHEVGELKRLVNVLLQEIDDWPAGGLLVAATNHADLLDPAVWRRFESRIEFPLPDARTAAALVEVLLDDALLSPGWQAALSTAFVGRSFSDIERDLRAARKASILRGRDLREAIGDLLAGFCRSLGKAALKRLALALLDAGLSARETSEITGLSRDTIRKSQASQRNEGVDHE